MIYSSQTLTQRGNGNGGNSGYRGNGGNGGNSGYRSNGGNGGNGEEEIFTRVKTNLSFCKRIRFFILNKN